ncbi:MAG: TonB-dependent hemoglobin/transferrin/lactoferrin family receptor [Leptolyngbyaceae cyanobacterium]
MTFFHFLTRTILFSGASLLTLTWSLTALAESEPIAASAEISTEESSSAEGLPLETQASDAVATNVDQDSIQPLNENESDFDEVLTPGSYETRAAELLAPVDSSDSAPITTAQTTNGDGDSNGSGTEGEGDFFNFEFEEGENLRLTVTGTRNPIPVENLPATVTVFELEDFNFYQVQSLEDLLRYEPGVSVRDNLRYGAQDVNIRGIEGNRVLFQVDNIRLPERFEFGPFNIGRADYVDFATLQAVEILRGPASTLYGSDAIGGVVSYRSLEPTDLLVDEDDDFASDLSTTYLSAIGGFENIARAAVRQDEASAVFVVSRRDGRETDTFAAQQFSDSIDREGTTIYGNFVYELDDFSRLSFIAEDFNRFSRRVEAPGNLGTLNNSETENIRLDRTRVSLTYEYEHPDSSSLVQYLQAQVYYQTATTIEEVVETRDSGSGAFTGQAVRRDTENQFIGNSYGGQVQLRSDFATGSWDHSLTYGLDVSSTFNSRPRDRIQTRLSDGATTNVIPPDTFPVKDFPDGETLRLGLYVQDEIEIGNLNIIAGLRFDYYNLTTSPDLAFERNGAQAADYSASAFSPRLALLYEVTPEISVYGQYARGFRGPLYSEINSGFTNFTSDFFKYETLSNPDLEAETSNSFEVGVRGNFPQFDFGITGFYNTYNNFIETFAAAGTRCLVTTNPCPTFNPPFSFSTQEVNQFQTQNVSEARIYGLELSGEYRFSPEDYGFSVLGSLAYVVGDDQTANQPLTSIDPFQAVVGLRYQSPEDVWRAELISTFTGMARVPDASTTFTPDAYAVFDLLGSYNVSEQVRVDLGIYNLFNTEYYNYSDIPLGLNANSPDIARFSQPGTNVKLGVTVSF